MLKISCGSNTADITLPSQCKIFSLCRTSTRYKCQKRGLLYMVEKVPLWQLWGRGNKSSPDTYIFLYNANRALGAKIINPGTEISQIFHIYSTASVTVTHTVFPWSAVVCTEATVHAKFDYFEYKGQQWFFGERNPTQLFLRWLCADYCKYKCTSYTKLDSSAASLWEHYILMP